MDAWWILPVAFIIGFCFGFIKGTIEINRRKNGRTNI